MWSSMFIVAILCLLCPSYVYCSHLMFIVVILCLLWPAYVYCGHLMFIVVILCLLWPSYVYCGQLMCIFNIGSPSRCLYKCRLHNYQSHTAKRLFLTYRLKITWLHVSASLYTPSSGLQTYRLTSSYTVPIGIPCTVLISNM
jgi:hypothetical protein